MRVLVIEDSEHLQRALADGLRRAGYAVDATADGNEGLWLAQSNDYDVIILDLMLPGLDGMSVLGRLRSAGTQTHVLVLTARGEVEDRVKGLRLGADDYLAKPFDFSELLARVAALIRRQHQSKNPIMRVADVEIDTNARTVQRAGHPVSLTPREYRLLEFLAMRAGQVVSRTDIEAHIYSDEVELFSNAVDSTISSLRKKLQMPGSPALIQTRRGMGYGFALTVE